MPCPGGWQSTAVFEREVAKKRFLGDKICQMFGISVKAKKTG